MMKTRLATNIEGCSLRLVLLLEKAYSNGAGLILSYWNTNEKSGPDFWCIFCFFFSQAKGPFESKIVYFPLLIKHEKRCMAGVMDLFSFLGTKNYRLEQNLIFTPDTLQEIRVQFQKATFKKINITGYFKIVATAFPYNEILKVYKSKI